MSPSTAALRKIVDDVDAPSGLAITATSVGRSRFLRTIASQQPLKAELKFNVWIVSGSPKSEAALFAFILQKDGRILSVGP